MNKTYLNEGLKPSFYFWQNKEKKEIDIIVERGKDVFPFEVKVAQTKNLHFFDNLKYWQKLHATPPELLSVIYGGNENFKTSNGNFISWQNIVQYIEKL